MLSNTLFVEIFGSIGSHLLGSGSVIIIVGFFGILRSFSPPAKRQAFGISESGQRQIRTNVKG